MKLMGLLVLILIVAWWVYMLSWHKKAEANGPPTPPANNVLNPSSPDGPQVTFPEQARSDNPEVNNFIVGFLNTLLANDYKAYRLHVTQRREPINMKAFDEGYGRVKAIEVKGVTKVESAKGFQGSELEGVPLPVYRVAAHVTLRDNSERNVDIWVFKEGNHWVSSN